MGNPECSFCRQLAALDRVPTGDVVGEFEHSVALLGSWQYYQGYTVVVARRHVTELNHLTDRERHGYFDEMCAVARAIQDCFRPHKLNYEMLGNQVPHLHWHVFPRYAADPDLLRPVWLALDRAERDPEEKSRLQTGPVERAGTAAVLRQRLRLLAPKSG